MGFSSLIFAYFTPETTIPLATALTAVVGFFLMVAGSPIRFARAGFRRVVGGARSLFKKLDL
jgi:hypothetical protein